MERCRICLVYKKNLFSVFECEQGISYSDMITSITSVKIVEDVYTNKICLTCRRKLRSLYDFKKMIERSHSIISRDLHRLKFDNIHEIKIELLKNVLNKMDMKNHEDIIVNCINLFHKGCDRIIYNDITIKKTTASKDIIMAESDSEYNHENTCSDTSQSKDTIFHAEKECKRRKEVQKKGQETRKNYSSNKLGPKTKIICIKPVVLNNIRAIRTTYKKDEAQRKHKYRRRQNMCSYCGIMSTNIKSHIMVHIGKRKYKCSECNKGFFTNRQLNVHKQKHTLAGIFKCDHCVAVFNNKISLQSHMVVHTEDKNHVCPVCNKSFKRKSAVLRHKLIHNSSARSYKCDLCNMSFLYKQGLRNHMRVHTGERPFKCEICAQPYSYKNDFNKHCLKKHGIFLKRRSVYIMNEEVLMQERALMKGLMLRLRGVVKEGEPMNPFRGPQAALAFEQTIKSLGSGQIPVDVTL